MFRRNDRRNLLKEPECFNLVQLNKPVLTESSGLVIPNNYYFKIYLFNIFISMSSIKRVKFYKYIIIVKRIIIIFTYNYINIKYFL